LIVAEDLQGIDAAHGWFALADQAAWLDRRSEAIQQQSKKT
jgi:hypothetical protein